MKTKGLSVVCGIVLVAVFLISSAPVKAWTVTGNLSKPATMYSGSTYSFSLDVTNTGSDSMYIDKIYLGFDWQSAGVAYPNTNVPKIIGSGDSFTFSWSIPIPDGITTNTQHIATVTIEAADPGIIDEWGYTTQNTITFTNVFISSAPVDDGGDTTPIDDTPDDGTTPGFDMPVIAVAAVVGVGIFAVVRRRNA